MKICHNGEMIEVEELIEEAEPIEEVEEVDKVTALIEGLSSATTLAQIRKVAKSILNSTNEDEVNKDGDS
ncbi:MAG: hypothetical protein UHH95_01360 [Oscillospiraceae bacterium]|nr:hypothetical protein [Oscillospiraceae bacterium]